MSIELSWCINPSWLSPLNPVGKEYACNGNTARCAWRASVRSRAAGEEDLTCKLRLANLRGCLAARTIFPAGAGVPRAQQCGAQVGILPCLPYLGHHSTAPIHFLWLTVTFLPQFLWRLGLSGLRRFDPPKATQALRPRSCRRRAHT